MKVRRTPILPLILLTFIIITVFFMGGIVYIINISMFTTQTEHHYNNKIVQEMAATIEQNVKSHSLSLKTYADLLEPNEFKNNPISLEILKLLSNGGDYENVCFVNINGIGYDMNGSYIDISDRQYFKDSLKMQGVISDRIIDRLTQKPIIVYATPIINDNKCSGILVAQSLATIDSSIFGDLLSGKSSNVYLFNKDNKLVSSTGEIEYDLTYDDLLKKGYVYNDIIEETAFDSKLQMHNFNTTINNLNKYFFSSENNKNYVWYIKPIDVNGWSIMVGKLDEISPEIKDLLTLTISIWLGIFSVMFLLLCLLITLQARSNKKLSRLAFTDQITGGMNWYRFSDYTRKYLRKKKLLSYAMVVFDVKKFKIINDIYGHKKGDVILKEIFMKLKYWTQKDELCARFMGDQFNALVIYDDKEELILRIQSLIQQINNLSGIPHIQYSFGVYVITDKTLTVDRIRDFASIAQDTVKNSIEQNIAFFNNNERDHILYEQEIEDSMEQALRDNEFIVYLQPKYDVVTNKIAGAEALVRWFCPNRGIISPGEFIPVFEKNGFIKNLDNYMLDHVCQRQAYWIAKGFPLVPISVNLSRVHMSDPNLVENIKALVDSYQIPHELIELEITESAFLDDKKSILNAVYDLRRLGFVVSMDDFGSGYSSLNSLKDLPLDVVKLDGEFFSDINDTQRGKSVIRDTIAMAKNLEMKIVAEGIETKEQVEFLQSIGCDMIQGYYFAKPMPIPDFEQLKQSEIDN